MVNFGDCNHTVLAFFAPGKSVNEALSSLKMGVLLWNEKKGSLFVIFGTSVMILHNRTLQRPFSKLKKNSHTNLYMLYPIVQSVALVCVESRHGKGAGRALFCSLSSSKKNSFSFAELFKF
jgi:hypothetical protein